MGSQRYTTTTAPILLLGHGTLVLTIVLATIGETLASAGDDGNVILWVPSDMPPSNLSADAQDDKESWRAKHMCRSSGAEIYDLAWSPDAAHFIIGSMDNIARIYNANSGKLRPLRTMCRPSPSAPLTRALNKEHSCVKLPNIVIMSRA